MAKIRSHITMPRRGYLDTVTRMTAVLIGMLITMLSPSMSSAQSNPIRIGLIASLSGGVAAMGTPERDSVEILAKKINSEGGIKGRKLELVIFDDTSSPTEAARGALKLIQQDKVVAIIGSTSGGATLALAPVAARYSTPLLATVATTSVVKQGTAFYPWTFRAMTDETITTTAMFEKLAQSKAKNIGIYFQEDAYGKSASEVVAKLAAAKGMKIVETVSSPLTATDLTAQATKLRIAEPDAVLLLVSPPSLVSGFARAARQVGLKASLWGGIAFGQKVYVDLIGKDGDGINAMLMANFDEPTQELKELAGILKAAGKSPNGFTEVAGTNALLHLKKALEADPNATGEKLRAALESVCQLRTYGAGSACYSADNHNGWNADALVLGQIRNGRFVTVK